MQYLGRGSDGRTPTYSQTDLLRAAHASAWAARRPFQLSFNVLNLFNQDTAVSKFSTYQKVNGVVPNEALFYTGQQTLEQLITSAEHRQGSALPDGQRVSVADPGARWRQVLF